MAKHRYQVRLLRAAEDDLTDIVSYIAADSPASAETVLARIEKMLSLLPGQPLLGKRPQDEDLAGMGYRFLITVNYLIFYTIENRAILVHRILHGARNYRGLL